MKKVKREIVSEDLIIFSHALEIPENIKQGNVQILFAHPESLLSVKGRTLLESKFINRML